MFNLINSNTGKKPQKYLFITLEILESSIHGFPTAALLKKWLNHGFFLGSFHKFCEQLLS